MYKKITQETIITSATASVKDIHNATTGEKKQLFD
jgi:hypothetical protein